MLAVFIGVLGPARVYFGRTITARRVKVNIFLCARLERDFSALKWYDWGLKNIRAFFSSRLQLQKRDKEVKEMKRGFSNPYENYKIRILV